MGGSGVVPAAVGMLPPDRTLAIPTARDQRAIPATLVQTTRPAPAPALYRVAPSTAFVGAAQVRIIDPAAVHSAYQRTQDSTRPPERANASSGRVSLEV